MKTIANFLVLVLLATTFSCGKLKLPEFGNSKKSEDPNIEYKREYWPDGETLKTEIPFLGKNKHGKAFNYYRNGQVRIELEYDNGVKIGEGKQFYDNGNIYQVTPYINGLVEGIQKKYHNNGQLMAEIPFSAGKSCMGLKEYLVDGSPRKNYPKAKIKEINQVMDGNRFILELSVDKDAMQAKFYKGKPDASGCFDSDNAEEIFTNDKRKANVIYHVAPNTFLMEEADFMIKMITRQRNPYWVHKKYNLAVENRR